MSTPSEQRPRLEWKRLLVLAGWLVALGCVFFFVGHRLFQANPWLVPPFETPPFDRHIDEYAWYHYTYHYDLFFHDRAFDFETWGADVPSIGQPNMVKFFFGFALESHDVAINSSREKMRSWWQPFTDDEAFKAYLAENLPFRDEALLVGRFYSAVFTYLTVVLCVVYVARVASLPTAVLFGLFIGHLPFLQTSRMMADSYSLFSFVLAILLFDIVAAWRGGKKSRVAIVSVYSVLIGIAMGIKLTGFLTLGFLPLYCLLECVKPSSERARLGGLLLALYHVFLAVITFIFFHPQTHDNPLLGIARFFQHQLPATSSGEVGLITRVGHEITHQVAVLVVTLQTVLRVDGLFLALTGLIVSLLVLGLISLLVSRPAPSTPLRFLPLILVIVSFTTLLSYEMDDRYTWFLTFVLAMLVFFGGHFLARCATLVCGRSAAEAIAGPNEAEGR